MQQNRPLNSIDCKASAFIVAVMLLFCAVPAITHAATTPDAYISTSDVKDVDFDEVLTSSGLGEIDIELFRGGGTNDNNGSGLDLDDANNTLPGFSFFSSNHDGSAWTTSWGKLREFYTDQFVDNGVDEEDIEIVLFADIFQWSGGITVNEVDIFAGVDFDAIRGTTDPRTTPDDDDLTANEQSANTPEGSGSTTVTRNAIINNNDHYLRALSSATTVGQGNSWAFPDGAIVTGINPFEMDGANYKYGDTENFVLWWRSSGHNLVSESIFLSSEYLMADLNPGIPLPGAAVSVLLVLPLLAFGIGRRRLNDRSALNA